MSSHPEHPNPLWKLQQEERIAKQDAWNAAQKEKAVPLVEELKKKLLERRSTRG